MDLGDRRRELPTVERLLVVARPLLPGRDPAAVLAAARSVLATERERVAEGHALRSTAEMATEIAGHLDALAATAIPTVINATGVVLHTNLGRAPWSAGAIKAASQAARRYLMLEMDAATGRRGRRLPLAEERLVAITSAEDAIITNNNAAAVALATRVAGARAGVAVARGELIEIGGGVRIPEVVRRAGLRLIEVGTTNKTRLEDYSEALVDGRARIVLRVHPSNFRMEGFVERPGLKELAELAHRVGATLVEDLGSGALLDTTPFGLAHEAMPQESLHAGVDLVTFSGDKLVGGPQSGLIVGRDHLIARIRLDPMARATRPDKVTLAALASTLGAYLAGTAVQEIPVWQMIATPAERLRERAEAILMRLLAAHANLRLEVITLASSIGGGSLPGETIPSYGLAVSTRRATGILAALRQSEPAVVARIVKGRVVLDLRTVLVDEDTALGEAVVRACLQ